MAAQTAVYNYIIRSV